MQPIGAASTCKAAFFLLKQIPGSVWIESVYGRSGTDVLRRSCGKLSFDLSGLAPVHPLAGERSGSPHRARDASETLADSRLRLRYRHANPWAGTAGTHSNGY